MGMKTIRYVPAAVILVLSFLQGATGTVFEDADVQPRISGYASFEAGEVVKGTTQSGETEGVWLETGYLGIRLEADINERLRILIGGEWRQLFSFRRSEGASINEYLSARRPRTVFLFKHGAALYSIGEGDYPLFQMETGFFPYKYNSDARNLGEYLFRSYCYPTAVLNMFDRPFADLVGARFGNFLPAGPGCFHEDIILNTNMTNNIMELWPAMDWSLSLLADFSIPRLLTVGAGIQWFNLIPVGLTNSQIGNPENPDPSLTGGRQLSFAGIKHMVRFSFDVKGLFAESTFFISKLGNEDLKLYGEAAVLGVKNYVDTISDTLWNQGFNKRSWRSPVMVGINLPAFKILDVLNFELEYWDSPYPNSYRYAYYDFLPLPTERTPHSKLKWSVYAKRSFGPNFSLIFQAARDHLIPYTAPNVNEFADKTDILLENADWWWTGKVRFQF